MGTKAETSPAIPHEPSGKGCSIVSEVTKIGFSQRLLTWPLAASVLAFSIAESPSLAERLAKAASFALFFATVAFFAALLADTFAKRRTRTINPFSNGKTTAQFLFLVMLLIVVKAVGLPFSIVIAVLAFLVIRPWTGETADEATAGEPQKLSKPLSRDEITARLEELAADPDTPPDRKQWALERLSHFKGK